MMKGSACGEGERCSKLIVYVMKLGMGGYEVV